MASRYLLTGPSGGQYHFVLKAGNGETILTSERYTTKAAANNGIQSVKTNSSIDARYVRKNATDGKPMFNLKAAIWPGQQVSASHHLTSQGRRIGAFSANPRTQR